MKTIVVMSRKGGAGKTTLATNLGVAAQQAGLNAVVADIDPLRSAAVALAGRADAAALLLETTADRLRAVRDACRRQGVRLLIVDTPPSPTREVAKAIEIADACLAVARPTALDLAAVEETIQLIWRRRRQGLVVLNQCPPARNGVEAGVTQRAQERLAFGRIPVATAKIRSRLAYQHALGAGHGVTELAPRSEAALDLQRLLVELGELIASDPAPGRWPAPDLREAPGALSDLDEPWGSSPSGLVAASAGSFWGFG